VRFTRAYVSDPLCCPSRATILTGRYAHGTHVYSNDQRLPTGGWRAFRPRERSTVATWLHAAGYRTALVGKYLNGYPGGPVPPGWDRWFAFATPPDYYNYTVSDDGVSRTFGSRPSDYATDVLARRAVGFIRSVPAGQPLFLEFAPYAPHVPSTPPRRYLHTVPVTSSWHPPNFNEANVSDKPAWLRRRPPFDAPDVARIDRDWAKQAEALRAVDDAVDAIIGALRASGRLSQTLVVFTSDNGTELGSHRYLPKEVPYEESVRVPLVVRYDPLTAPLAGTSSRKLVVNIDYAPTFAATAGVAAPGAEGRSFLPLLRDPSAAFRSSFLLEHIRGRSPIPAYCGVVTQTKKLVEYSTGERELYDLAGDPFELVNRAGDPRRAGAVKALHARLRRLCSPPPPGFH
jgi:N-acetylglucosamine-6-sulfatase